MFNIDIPCPNPKCEGVLSVPVDAEIITCPSCKELIPINEGDNSKGKELSEELDLLGSNVSEFGGNLSIDKK